MLGVTIILSILIFQFFMTIELPTGKGFAVRRFRWQTTEVGDVAELQASRKG